MLKEEIIEAMLHTAKVAMLNAYTPYRGMEVGACALAEDGTMYGGCNIENASPDSYGSAECVAMYKAVADGKREFDGLLVIADTEEPFVPSGRSLEVMAEFNVLDVVIASVSGDYKVIPLPELFPSGQKLRANHRNDSME